MDGNKNKHICKHDGDCRHEGCCHGHSGNCTEEGHCNEKTEGWGGKRSGAGRKCEGKKIPFNRRLSEEAIQKIKAYAEENNVSETEALEIAIKKLIFETKNKSK